MAAREEVMAVEIEGSVTPFRVAADDIPTVVIANRNEINRAGIGLLLDTGGYRVVARCSDEHDLLCFVETFNPNVILVADNIADLSTAETVRRLRARNRSAVIILLLEERQAIAATDLLDLNVDGILLSVSCAKSIIGCCESVLHGRKWIDPLCNLTAEEPRPQIASSLTSREAEVAHLVSQGLRNKEIARELHLSLGTVKMYLHHIYKKLRLGGRTQLALSTVAARATTKLPDFRLTSSNRRVRSFLMPFCLIQSSSFDTIAPFFQI